MIVPVTFDVTPFTLPSVEEVEEEDVFREPECFEPEPRDADAVFPDA